MASTILQLRQKFDQISAELAQLLGEVRIRYYDRYGGGIIVVAPEYYWADRTPEQNARQIRLKRRYEEWFELFRSVFRQAPDQLQHKIEEADKGYRRWLEFSTNWSLAADAETNLAAFNKDVAAITTILQVFASSSKERLLVVPDTNALIGHPDPVDYRTAVEKSAFTFLLLPTVLAELDNLKINHRNPDLRDKADKTVQRIKGWRNQGSLREGVTVDKTITVRALANEPKMDRAPSWLDAQVNDDRLIASILEVQAAEPEASVLLVTGDINLANKADNAGITCTDFSP